MALRTLARSLVFALAFCLVVQPAVYAQEAPAQQSSTAQDNAAQTATATQPDAATPPDNSAQIRAELKQIGKGSQVIVAFDDGSTRAGRIKRINSESFTLDEGNKGAGNYLFANVSSVSRPQGSNVGAKVVPIAFATTALIVVAGLVGFAVTKERSGSTTAATTPAK